MTDLKDISVLETILPSKANDDEKAVALEQYAKLINGWFWETDTENRFVYMSDSVKAITGIAPEWHYGKTRTELRSPSIDDTTWSAHIEALNAHEPFYDFRFKRVGPEDTRWLSTSGEPFYDADGTFQGYRGVARDITDQVALSTEAEQSKAQLISALEIIDEAFVYFDADDRLVMCNEKYRQYYPKSSDAIVPGALFEDIIREGAQCGEYEEALGREEEWIRERMTIHNAADTFIEQRLTDGRWLRIAERRSPDGGIVGMRVDITNLKKVQEAAEAANRAKTDFLNVMSHELRTPLTVILGFTPVLQNPKKLPSVKKLMGLIDTDIESHVEIENRLNEALDDIIKFVGKMDTSGKHLLALINDMLDLTKIESGKMELEFRPVHVDQLIEAIVEQFTNAAEAKNLALHYQTNGGSVFADDIRLRQILINLVGNAIKFTDAGSIEISTRQHEGFVEFSVKDTGCGIDGTELESVFERFKQADASSTRKAGGTGLGLAITKHLVELHNGNIEVSSNLGQGSTFKITIPSADPVQSTEN